MRHPILDNGAENRRVPFAAPFASYDRGSIPGDVYFDNVRLAAPLDIEQLVPCAGPLSGGRWKSHGQYVASVVEVVEA